MIGDREPGNDGPGWTTAVAMSDGLPCSSGTQDFVGSCTPTRDLSASSLTTENCYQSEGRCTVLAVARPGQIWEAAIMGTIGLQVVMNSGCDPRAISVFLRRPRLSDEVLNFQIC